MFSEGERPTLKICWFLLADEDSRRNTVRYNCLSEKIEHGSKKRN